ncbi:hypothetical protein F4859DRAFT_499448 [Xylaria cf. heliscus]|nr:hypothetical protein F4859DRAFT_499448 [Xylaria cf. heliscus]
MGTVYHDDVVDFDELDTSDPITLELYLDPEAHHDYKQGQARTQFHVPDDGVTIYQNKERSGSHISVQRLLWVDGWQDGKNEESAKQMTLVVLKFNFVSSNRIDQETKLAWVEASLSFWDKDKTRGQDPVVIAWAPREPEKWNQSSAHAKRMTKTGASATIGYEGTNASVNWGKEREIEWDYECFDEGRTTHLFNPKTGKPNGVSWYISQNPLQNHGLMPEFWAALLVSRQSSDPYLARFTLESASGRYQNKMIDVKEMLGLRKNGSAFSVTPKPGEVAVCNLEGENIIKSIDLGHLGCLVDPERSTRLNVKWGPRSKDTVPNQAEAGEAVYAREGDDRGLCSPIGQIASDQMHRVQPSDARVDSAELSTITGPGSQPALPRNDIIPQQIIRASPHLEAIPDDNHYRRLVALEDRVAQAEARLATQDLVIMQLREAIMTRNMHDPTRNDG